MQKIQKLKIGKIELKNNLFLAPMAGISDLPMRLLSKEGGAGLVCTEMVSAKALTYGNEKTKKLYKIHKNERPVAVQIFGGDRYCMSEAAKIVRDAGADIIDINLGCPVRKITKAGAGAKLLTDGRLTAAILADVINSVDIPVTIKIRTGLIPGENAAIEILKIAYENGISLAVIHARPAKHGHDGEPDMEVFTQACSQSKIPIIANGGIYDESSAEKFINIPNCRGLMIGRGAIGNYSIFKGLESYFNDGIMLAKPSWQERILWLKKHAALAEDYYEEERGYVLLRKVLHYYVKDLPNAAKIRNMFNKVTKPAEFEEFIEYVNYNISNKKIN
ncbi:MAG: tRNA dihydrouridine synthase DusB [Endomicrobium sp.]|jgi:tRNA-dihydrouridine synthase B|nr:tRNA dihydrouridine synthase DusB [Endomicrobium sp.]